MAPSAFQMYIASFLWVHLLLFIVFHFIIYYLFAESSIVQNVYRNIYLIFIFSIVVFSGEFSFSVPSVYRKFSLVFIYYCVFFQFLYFRIFLGGLNFFKRISEELFNSQLLKFRFFGRGFPQRSKCISQVSPPQY